MSRRTIKVDMLARVEGEGALTIRFSGKTVRDVELRIFEPPRFFEAFLRGRNLMEVPDITARICGICPVAYQMSSCHAIEHAVGVKVDGALRDLRRLIYCGEWIESHVLHCFLLHAPDFLGYQDALAMARDHGDKVQLGLRLKKAGNSIVARLGGREIHPINVRVGGFYRVPPPAELRALLPELEWAQNAARDALHWLSTLRFPDFERDYTFVALRHAYEYPLNEGRIVSNQGLDIAIEEYDRHFEEVHVEHSNALHSVVRNRDTQGVGDDYFCGPLARFNLNFDRLPPELQREAQRVGVTLPCRNPFKSLLVRMLEVAYAFDEAVRIIKTYEQPARAFVDVPLHAGTGYGCTEAPRGILYHRYKLSGEGVVEDAKIVPPTSQNQKCIEADLRQIAPRLVQMAHADATWLAEQTVRNYDPCISCATHFLKLDLVDAGVTVEPDP